MSWRVTLDGTEVDTPDGLQDLRSTLRRDFNSGGVFWRFTGDRTGIINLKFIGTGATILNNAWTVHGVDARVYLTIEKQNPGLSTYTTVYTGFSNMRSRSYDTDYFICSFEEVSLINQINSNLKTRVNLSTTRDIYGNAISAANYDTITFGSFDLQSSGFLSNGTYTFSAGSVVQFEAEALYELKNEIRFGEGNIYAFRPDLIGDKTGSIAKYGGRLQFIVQSSSYSVDVTASGEYTATLSGSPTGTLTLKLIRKNLATGVETTVDSDTINTADGNQFNVPYSFTDTQTVSDTGYEYFIELEDDGIAGGGADSYTVTIEATLLGETNYGASGTTASVLREFHAINKNLEIVTGQGNLLYSDYLQGTLADLVETNGYQLRTKNRGLTGSLKDRFDMLKGVFGLGWGVEQSYTGDLDTVRVEEYEYFFNNSEMLDLTARDLENDSYFEEYEEELSFSRVVTGYDKFSNDEEFSNISSLDDFNTQASYKLPVENLEDTLNLKTNFIASPILIELTRRKQFFLFDDKAWKYDDDLFLIDCEDTGTLAPRPETNILNDVTFTYNLLLNPRFSFFNNGKLINSVMYGKSATSIYFNEEYKVNQDGKIGYSTLFSSPPWGDVRQYASIGSVPANNSSPLAAHVRSFDPIFEPVKIKFKIALSSSEVTTLIDGHRNALVSGNYGYISITNPLGDIVNGWLMNLEYNPVDEIGSFELIKKADDYFQ